MKEVFKHFEVKTSNTVVVVCMGQCTWIGFILEMLLVEQCLNLKKNNPKFIEDLVLGT